MTMAGYLSIAAEKRAQAAAKIPLEWRLPASILSDVSGSPTAGVMGIPRTCGILTATEIEITEQYTAIELRSAQLARKLSAVEILTAFSKRAAIAQQLVVSLAPILVSPSLNL